MEKARVDVFIFKDFLLDLFSRHSFEKLTIIERLIHVLHDVLQVVCDFDTFFGNHDSELLSSSKIFFEVLAEHLILVEVFLNI